MSKKSLAWIAVLAGVLALLLLLIVCGIASAIGGALIGAGVIAPQPTKAVTATGTIQPTTSTLIPTPTPTPSPVQTAIQPPAAAPALTEALQCLGFNSPEEVVSYFHMVGVDPAEVALVPDGHGGHEPCAVRVHREKDSGGRIVPFWMCNPSGTVFNGWRMAGQSGGQAGVPPGCWWVEGITIRPWR